MSIKYNGGYIPAVGADGTTLGANSASATGVAWAGPSVAAGKNAIINGGMDIWQRGTSLTAIGYTADRWFDYFTSGGCTFTQDSTTVPSGFRYSLKATTSGASGAVEFVQAIETANVIPLAGQTVALSFYAACSTSVQCIAQLNYSTSVDNNVLGTYTNITGTTVTYPTLSTTMQKYVITFVVPSTAKTLQVVISPNTSLAAGSTFNLTGVQLELGSTATTFSRAGGTLSGELAACQRYYYRSSNSGSSAGYGAIGGTQSTTSAYFYMPLPVQMRTNPTALEYANVRIVNYGVAAYSISSMSLDTASTTQNVGVFTADGATGMTANRPVFLYASVTNNYVGFTAEL